MRRPDDVVVEVALEARAGDPLERLDVAGARPGHDVGRAAPGRAASCPSPASRASRGRTACRSSPGTGPARSPRRPRTATSPGVMTSSIRSSSPVAGSIPNSNFVSARITPGRLGDLGAAPVQARSRASATRSATSRPTSSRRLVDRDVLVVALLGLRRGREERLRQAVALAQPGRQRDPAHRAGPAVVLPARAREVAADDRPRSAAARPAGRASSGRAGRRPSAGVSRAAARDVLGRDADEVVRDEVRGPVEPEPRQAGQDPALVRDRRRQDDVERAEAVRRDEQQPVVADARTGRGPCRSAGTSRRAG